MLQGLSSASQGRSSVACDPDMDLFLLDELRFNPMLLKTPCPYFAEGLEWGGSRAVQNGAVEAISQCLATHAE